ncbi:MAG: YwaF family protein [Clostridia bacterium]|nr:YwaF family protein [Clostridia bacterium]
MIIDYGSTAHCLYLLFLLLCFLGLYFLFRNRPRKEQYALLLVMMGLNIVQHLFKAQLYPHLAGTGFSLENTAYNVCAFLILVQPFLLCSQRTCWKNLVFYVGAVGPLLALLAPTWFIGKTIWQWEFFRFFLCHAVLFLTSILPIAWGIDRISYKNCWKIGFLFLFMLGLVLLNDFLCIFMGLSGDARDLYGELMELNPLWVMHPPEGFDFIVKVFTALTPSVFLPSASNPYYTPVLWYAIPFWLLVTLLGFIVGAITDRENFKHDAKRFTALLKRIGGKIRNGIAKVYRKFFCSH